MKANRYYRKYIEKAIHANPTEITIRRIQRIPDGFDGWIEEEVTLPAQTVTIYTKKAHRERMNDSGTTVGYMVSSLEKMLCAFDADIMQGDKFTANGREYKVTFVNDYLGICKQAELEVIQ